MSLTGPVSLDLVRHAESEGNLADLRAHQSGAAELVLADRDADVELSATGLEQAAALGRWVGAMPPGRRPQAVISSPYRRARQTAQTAIGGGELDLPLLLDERLRERELGIFDGLTARGIAERYPQEAQRRARIGKFYYRPPGGESWVDVALRIRSLLADLRDYDGQRLMLVSHQAVIMSFRYVLERLTEEQILAEDAGPPLANCSLTRYVAAQPGVLTLELYNEVPAAAPVTAEPAAEEPDAVHP